MARHLLILLFQIRSPLQRKKNPSYHLVSLVNSLLRIHIAKEFTRERDHIFEHYVYCCSSLLGEVGILSKDSYSFCLLWVEEAILALVIISGILTCVLVPRQLRYYKNIIQPPAYDSKKDKMLRAMGLQGQRSKFPINNIKICSRKHLSIDSNGIGHINAKYGKSNFWLMASQWLCGDHQM